MTTHTEPLSGRKSPRKSPRRDREIPLALLFPPVFAAVYLLHLPLLRLPYYWDEGGYYIPAAWDFWRLGTVIPVSTVRNAHPPLPSILLAGWWKLTGFHIYSTRLLLCMITAFALLGVYRIARGFAGETVGGAVLLLTATYPVWFAQSTLAHADMFAAAATLWALSFYFDQPGWTFAVEPQQADGVSNHEISSHTSDVSRNISIALCFSLAVLSKETAIVLPATLVLFEAGRWWHAARTGSGPTRTARAHLSETAGQRITRVAALAFPALPLVGWYVYHRVKTGFMFGNPEYLRYNATANLSATRVLLSLWHRAIHLTVHMNLFVPVLLTLAALWLPVLPNRRKLPASAVASIWAVLIGQWIAFSVLGGALLTRYLLPAYPLLLLLCVAVWRRHVAQWGWLAALSLAGFAAGCVINPPYPFAPEDNLAYADMIRLHQEAIRKVESLYPGATVLSAWPVTADLQRPELGYTRQPVKTAEIQNFTAEEVAKAAQKPGDYDAAIVFSTKYNPPPGGLNVAVRSGANDARYFDAHRDLLPAEVARALGGTVVWQEERHGEWAAVLHFNRSYDARLGPALTR